MRWETKPLGEVCEIIGGGTPSKKVAAYYGGEIPWATVGDMNVEQLIATDLRITPAGLENSSARVIPSGNVIIATRVGLGKSCILNQDTAINQDLKGLVPKGSIGLLPRFLFRWTQSIAPRIIGAGTGATVQGVKIKFVSQLPIPVPSIEEQERIVEVLDEAFASIDKAKANIERNLTNDRELFQSRLNDVFSNPFEDWEVSKLEAVLDMYQPKTISQKEMVEDGKFPVFGANGQIGWYNEFNHENPEVLLTCRGATCGFLNWSLPNSWINGNAMVMRPKDSSQLSQEFLFKALEGGVDTTRAITGSAQPQITRKSLNPLCIPIPPLDEQEFIVRELGALDEMKRCLETKYQSELDNLKELRQSILEQAFEGKLTEPVAA